MAWPKNIVIVQFKVKSSTTHFKLYQINQGIPQIQPEGKRKGVNKMELLECCMQSIDCAAIAITSLWLLRILCYINVCF